MIPLDDAENPISAADFDPIELRFAAKLPKAFKDFYLANNGGYPQGNRIRGDKFVYSINGFTPIKHGKLPMEKLTKDYAESFPELIGYLPFAYDDGGNGFVLSLRRDDHGRIYLWLYDERRLEPVCSSFEAFLAAIYLED